MDGLSITKAVKILKKRYEGSRLTKVTVTEDSVCLGVYSKERVSILVRITGGKPSVHPVFKQVGVPDQALDRLNGGTITDVGGRKYDRIIFIDVEKRRPSGKIERNRLVFELIGKMGNAMMVNSEGMINWTFCKNNPDADRAMGVGQSYQLPKSNKRQTLEEYSSEDFSDLLGFYPVTVKHAGKYMEANYSFAEVAVLIKEYLEDEEFYLDTAGKLLPFKPLENGEPVSFDSIAELSDKTAQKRRDDGIKLRLERYFEKQLQRYKGLKVKLETELKAAEQHEETLKRAELIKSNIYKLKGRKGIVELDDYTEDEIRKVPYDIPDDFDVNGELERLYKKAEKLKRSLPLIKERIKEIDNIVDSAQEQLYFISISASDDELRELSAEMRKSVKGVKRQTSQKQFIKLNIGGGTAYLGKNSVSNHRLVFHFANPSDWWFHAQRIPSAHLIFRKNGGMTDDEKLKCAAIVAGLSRAKNDLKVTVDYTQKKHVKKPKNTPPGFVIYHRFFSVTVEPEDIENKITGEDDG